MKINFLLHFYIHCKGTFIKKVEKSLDMEICEPSQCTLSVLLGCVGGVCALSNVLGKETCELYALAKQGHFEEAKTLQQKLIPPNTAVSLANFFYNIIVLFS